MIGGTFFLDKHRKNNFKNIFLVQACKQEFLVTEVVFGTL
jgi:hypothetical protein